MLTKVQKKRLAREARKLAMECLTNGPEMRNLWCGCAVGLSLKRAGLWPGGDADLIGEARAIELERDFSCLSDEESAAHDGILSQATRERSWRDNPTAVVIPLLAWADFLVESSEQPPAGPPKEF